MTAQIRILHPDCEDYCQHDEIEVLCETCRPIPGSGTGGTWSDLLARIDDLLTEGPTR
jgi:hypothetical protein